MCLNETLVKFVWMNISLIYSYSEWSETKIYFNINAFQLCFRIFH